MREVLLFFDRPAEQVIAAAAAFFAGQGVHISHHSAYSVAFVGAGGQSDDGGQVAAVPVQLRPEWCRVWVSVGGAGAAGAAADAFVAQHRDTSRRVQPAVHQLERNVYDEARWPAYEAQLRASLTKQGVDPAAVGEKVAAFKRRWLALGRKAAAAPPEEPEPA